MKKLIATVAVGAAFLASALPAFAAKPANPGCFGRDRAENITTWIMNKPEPGASWWGHVAASRAGTNGAMNQAYKDGCGGSPTL